MLLQLAMCKNKYIGKFCSLDGQVVLGYLSENNETKYYLLSDGSLYSGLVKETCCTDITCQNGRQVGLLDIINEVNIISTTPSVLDVTLVSALFIDNSGALTTSTYTLDDGNGNIQPILIGTIISIDVSGFLDIPYVGTILSSNGAKVQFEYIVLSGEVMSSSTYLVSNVDYSLDCSLYPNYTIEIGNEYHSTPDSSTIGFLLSNNGTLINSGVDETQDLVVVTNSNINVDGNNIVLMTSTYNAMEFGALPPLETIIILNTQCNSTP